MPTAIYYVFDIWNSRYFYCLRLITPSTHKQLDSHNPTHSCEFQQLDDIFCNLELNNGPYIIYIWNRQLNTCRSIGKTEFLQTWISLRVQSRSSIFNPAPSMSLAPDHLLEQSWKLHHHHLQYSCWWITITWHTIRIHLYNKWANFSHFLGQEG